MLGSFSSHIRLGLIMGKHLVGEQNFFLYSKRLAFEK
jgi:hypothetical protein